MREKLNAYIKEKYTGPLLFSSPLPNQYQESVNMAEVAQLEKLTPNMKALHEGNDFSGISEIQRKHQKTSHLIKA